MRPPLQLTQQLILTGLLLCGSVYGLAADSAQGEQKTGACVGCHGEQGNSTLPEFPKLAGQHANYLLKQLIDIQQGLRIAPQMAGLLERLSQDDLADIAAYYSEQTSTVNQADPQQIELGRQLYMGGNLETGLTACVACHSPTGQGNAAANFPRLGGQHAQYIATQLRKFRQGYRSDSPTPQARINDGSSKMMQSIAFKLRDFEIEALASYISGLH